MIIRKFPFLLCVLLLVWNTASASTLSQEFTESFYYNVKQVGALVSQESAGSRQIIEENPYQLPRYKGWLEFRPDFQFSIYRFDISGKPRVRYEWEEYQNSGLGDTTEDKLELFINEYLLRFQASERMFVSWGRENLQWGPGWLFSPSNPFFIENGRISPMTEIPGKDFARLVYLPDMIWTVSLIANLGKGRWELPIDESFEQTYAVKLDYSGVESYAGLILSYQENMKNSLGGFAGWTISDALLLHTDFSVSETLKQDDSYRFALLAGGSYTFETGSTITLEYAHQQNEVDFSKRNNFLLQYSQNDIWEMLSIIIQATVNIEDHSSQYITIVELAATDHSLFFINTSYNSGGEGKEFGEFLDYRVMCGLEYSF
ncbi:MAG TPA: hypothetical protein EYG88_13870 [Desulfocapsa sulfexigens]|nr:hypothetical protein [Desulfocapsa sulfexigens]